MVVCRIIVYQINKKKILQKEEIVKNINEYKVLYELKKSL